LAFSWLGEPPDLQGIYVKLVAGGTQPLRISPAGKTSNYPTWSPDGTRVAYLRPDGSDTDILVAPALGGPERRIGHYSGPASSISWSPDGKWMAAAVSDKAGTASLQLIALETGELHRLTQAPDGARDLYPRFSPDGRAVAFLRRTGPFNILPFWIPLRPGGMPSGEPRQIGSRHWNSSALDWFPDGKSLVMPAIAGASCQYWKIPISGGIPVRLPLEFPHEYTGPILLGVSLRGTRLAVLVNTSQSDIGRLEWSDTAKRFQPAEFYDSSRSDEEIQVSPNGKWVVFCSTRSGFREIWRANRDGSQALVLTSLPDQRLGSPRWSFDNQFVAFDISAGGPNQIWVVTADGGKARAVTADAAGHNRPSFSSDGKWIYFGTTPFSGIIRRLPFAGGATEPVTTHGYEAFESPDGHWLYYAQSFVAGGIGIYRRPTAGGPEQLILRDPRAAAWAIAGNHVYVGMAAGEDSGHILRIDPDSGRKEEVFRFPPEARRFSSATSLAVSGDERTIYHTGEKRREADILLVDNFR
jgi:Tol biopolymer transport system component